LEKLILRLRQRESQKIYGELSMKKSAIYAIVAVIVIIVVIIAAVFALGLIPTGGTPQATPTPTASTAPGAAVANATTLTFSANITTNGATTTYSWSGKNLHSTNETLRVDFATYAYILDAGAQKSWMSTDSGATWTQGVFNDDWTSWGPQWSGIVDNLAHWTSGETYTYTETGTGATVVVYNVVVNPTIPDSTFTAA
jgi:hypothetical protein